MTKARFSLANLAILMAATVGFAAVAKTADPAPQQQDINKSTEIFRALYADLKSHDFDAKRVAVQNYRLPDQDLTEYAPNREKDLVDIVVADASMPEYSDIAFYTDIYVKLNVRRLSGDKAECNPEGFFLVAWKNGRITQVPFGEARMVTRPKINHYQTYLPVFPGMKAYRDTLPMLPYWAAAKNKPTAAP